MTRAKRDLDSYRLPGRILVRLEEDRMGNVTIAPVSERWRKAVAASNAYDGSGDVFIQEAHVEEWADTLPRSAFYGRCDKKRFNDGARFYIDSWTFRHLVGGQSD